MIRRSVFAIAFILVVSLGAWPERSEAATISMMCWNEGPHGTLQAPVPTVGCTFSWAPGGLSAHYADFEGGYPVCSPGCVVIPGEWNEPNISVNVPAFGSDFDQLDLNCTQQVISVTVVATAISYKSGRGDPIEVDAVGSSFVLGAVGIFCS